MSNATYFSNYKKFSQKILIRQIQDGKNVCMTCEQIKFITQKANLNQNAEYSNTSQLVKLIAEAHGKKMPLVKGTAWALKLMSHVTGLVNKAFGSLSYDRSISEYAVAYQKYSLQESIQITEKS